MSSLSQLPDVLYERLESLPFIAAQGFDYFPCRVVLTDGRVVDRAYLFRLGKRFSYATPPEPPDLLGYIWHGTNDRYVSLKDVVSVERSPFSLPVDIVKKIAGPFNYREKEYRCTLLLKDGRRLPYIAPLMADFPDLPPDVAGVDVVDALPYDYKTPLSRIHGTADYSICLFEAHRERWLRDPLIHEAMRVPSNLIEDLRRIETSWHEYRPCRMTLKSGEVRDHVVTFPAEGAHLNVDADYLWMKDVVKIEESPDRLPKRLAEKISRSGPVGREECYYFTVVFRDGRRLHFRLHSFSELLALPAGYAIDQIADVVTTEGSEENPLPGPDISHCPYLSASSKHG